jgi:CDP-diacylglycerol--glycerol-3-phosphate 3-phosphatidyltransferase
MNLPNSLTLIRIFLVPLVVVILISPPARMQSWAGQTWAFWGTSLFLAAALTDLLDGYLARRRKQVTTLGRLLDPIADKLLISSALISLVQIGLAPAWMVTIIIGREFAVSGLRSIAASEGFSIEVSTVGKGKMVLQVAAITGLILGAAQPGWITQTAKVLLWAVVISALVSMVQYFVEFWSKLDSNIKNREYRRSRILERRRQIRAERRELRRLRKLEKQRKLKAETEPPSFTSLGNSG